MKKLKGHLSNFEDAQEILEYEDYVWHGGSMSEIVTNYHSEWEKEFEEEIIKKVLEEDE